MSLIDVKSELSSLSLGGLRSRLRTLSGLRDTAQGWTADEYDYLSDKLMAYTDAVLHELAKKEQGEDYEPYPHPMGEAPMDQVKP